MERILKIQADYLYIPIQKNRREKCITFYLQRDSDEEKLYEFLIPVYEQAEGSYPYDFMAEIPVSSHAGCEIRICGDVPKAFLNTIINSSKMNQISDNKPLIHFAVDTGWSNDPNGLVYSGGIYHFYFQYNPFDVRWKNMSWGHAVSRDLLHWEQKESVMFPDEDGTIFSGCAIVNERELLDLPKDALIYYYSAAGGDNTWSKGKQFVQKMAYSLDGGMTLRKVKQPVIPVINKDTRDPKVFWHEQTQAYIMVLWLHDHEYAILRSTDLKKWEIASRLEFMCEWECPDLLYLTDEKGEGSWFFWTPDGDYYTGSFDGFTFTPDGNMRRAYVSQMQYAAQTYSNTPGRTISVPWLRSPNDGRNFTGAYGIPVELSAKKVGDTWIMVQNPVRELREQAGQVFCGSGEEDITWQVPEGVRRALIVDLLLPEDTHKTVMYEINGSRILYDPESGIFAVDHDRYQVPVKVKNLQLLIDDRYLEVFFDGGTEQGTFTLRETDVRFSAEKGMLSSCKISEVR